MKAGRSGMPGTPRCIRQSIICTCVVTKSFVATLGRAPIDYLGGHEEEATIDEAGAQIELKKQQNRAKRRRGKGVVGTLELTNQPPIFSA